MKKRDVRTSLPARAFSRLASCLFAAVLGMMLSGMLSPAYGQWLSHPIGTMDGASWIDCADLNNDGEMDAVVSSYTSDLIICYTRTGTTWTPSLIGNLNGAGNICIEDINGDDTLDVVATGFYANQLVWYEGPNWTPRIIDTNLIYAYGLDIADMDNDGDLDAVATEWGGVGKIRWYENTGTGWFKETIHQQNGGYALVDIADIDSDGDLDVIATGIFSNMVAWYEAPTWDEHLIDSGIDAPYGIFCADMDADSDLDAVVGIENELLVVWYENDGAGSTWSRHIIDDHQAGGGPVYVADIDDDLDPDVVMMAYFADSVFWYQNNELSWTRHYVGHLGEPWGVFVGDMDNDLDLDIAAVGHSTDNIVWFENVIVGVEPLPGVMPSEYVLYQNYPNPFNPSTSIEFSLPKADFVTLKIYDVTGAAVATLVSEQLPAGSYQYQWDARELASGLYFYRLEAGEFAQSRKMLLIR